MVRKAFIALAAAALALPANAQDEPSDPLDKTVWLFWSSTRSVFWITARDMTWQQGGEPLTVWIHGDHTNDTSVKYRKSIHRISLDCKGAARTSAFTTYNADNTVSGSWDGYGNTEYIRPGSMMADLERKMCPANK